MLFIFLKATEQDWGVALLWRCPRCNEPREFHWIARRTAFMLMTLELTRSAWTADLRCGGCGYELRVDPADKDKLAAAGKLTTALHRQEITVADYRQEVCALDARFVADLVALTEEWACPSCGESNPVTFQQCWKCRQANVQFVAQTGTVERPQSQERGRYPWEM